MCTGSGSAGKDAHANGLNDDADNNKRVDAFAKGPLPDAKGGGKGAPKGRGGTGDDPEVKAGRQWNFCRGWGHYGRECPNREKVNPQSGKSFGSEYDAHRVAKSASNGGRRRGVSRLEGDDNGVDAGHEQAAALDEDVVLADLWQGEWEDDKGDLYALASGTRGSPFSCPR